jgi:hypothetical protein
LAQSLFHLFLHSFKKRRSSFTIKIIELVAQLVEQYTFNVWVLGSSPSQFTKPLEIEAFFMPFSLYIRLGKWPDNIIIVRKLCFEPLSLNDIFPITTSFSFDQRNSISENLFFSKYLLYYFCSNQKMNVYK